ncbi:MAG: reverse transcriptase domain-containing protein [Flavobacteriales bacterium]|jgi:GTPase SAR1 family protein|nr:reverse transcriptase domain-containing protein [Flavobacteriales bacterium]
MKDFPEWFKIKRYPHIGFPITGLHFNRVSDYIYEKDNIEKHNFSPLLYRRVSQRKFRKKENNPKEREKKKLKIRHLYFASHIDAHIYSYYNQILIDKYENFLQGRLFDRSVVAYRKIPIEVGKKPNCSNIDFAKQAFEFVHKNTAENLSVIVSDITGFFDNLDHKILKKNWSKIIDERSLPNDHYNIFKSLTKLRYVHEKKLFEALGNNVYVKRGRPHKPFNPINPIYLKKKVSNIKYFKEKDVVAFCTKEEFYNKFKQLIVTNKKVKGIPQGTPISATLANIYMIDFDNKLSKFIDNLNGFYQRYSDDIILICDSKHEERILEYMLNLIKEEVKLEIHLKKTKLYRFIRVNGTFDCFLVDKNNKAVKNSLEYLGFKYNGKKVLIKESGIAKYYRSMKRSIRRRAFYAKFSNNRDKNIFKSSLYKRFTYKGAKRKRFTYKPKFNNPKEYIKTDIPYWGNYLSYVYLSNKKFRSLNMNDSIKRQSRKFWNKYHNELRVREKEVFKCHKTKSLIIKKSQNNSTEN